MRKDPLVNGEVYHIFNKSIAGYTIFNNDAEFLRMFNTIRYYQREKPEINFSKFFTSTTKDGGVPIVDFAILNNKKKLVEIISYCLMPTHFHLILKQFFDNGITIFMNKIENSYSRYFNIKHNRKGPLWESRFRSVLVKSDEQLLHLTRYIHLNPVTAFLVENAHDWQMSSFNEYVQKIKNQDKVSRCEDILDIKPHDYESFVKDRAGYQRELAKIKDLLLDEPYPTA